MAVAGISVALSLVGALTGVVGSFLQYSAAKKAEKLRMKQAQLEAARGKREQIRKTQAAQASATASAYNQGAGASSALAGGLAQIQNTGARNTVAIQEDLSIGNNIYKANQQANFGSFLGSLGGGVSSLGGAVSSQAGTITRLGGAETIFPFMKDKAA